MEMLGEVRIKFGIWGRLIVMAGHDKQPVGGLLCHHCEDVEKPEPRGNPGKRGVCVCVFTPLVSTL